ncbi:MAG: hypothetical protein HQL01_09770 [Nitrospirae bacterium]|nr:hypothetical protein [Nitrospirota bacterium]
MVIEDKLLKLMMDIGYLGCGYGYFKDAVTVFGGLEDICPDSESPLIGMAVAMISRGQCEKAEEILKDHVLTRFPQSDIARSFHGFALKILGKKSESITVLKEVVGNNRDTAAVNLASALLAEMQA